MKKLVALIILTVICFRTEAQSLQRPKLVVGVVVDQMRWDYLYRFYDRYGNDGFKRLIREGFNCENTFIPYAPTVTAAGHACIYTGSVPALNGIIGNSWYDRQTSSHVYCSDDNNVNPVGSQSSGGKMSPRNLWSSTITDELRLATNFKSKSIAIALKDRGSIFPGGHMANAAYWYDYSTGGWMTSSYYMKDLPKWVKTFNERKIPDQYLAKNWNSLYPVDTYTQSTSDSNAYEGKLEDLSFPHLTTNRSAGKYQTFANTPWANRFTVDMAEAVIENENLGARNTTDFLSVSFSSTDYIGHLFGPNSMEVEDTYLRLDKDLGDFLNYLDKKIGKGEYLLFLSSDHGVANNPVFISDNKGASGISDLGKLRIQLNDSLERKFSVKNLVENSANFQLYLDRDQIRNHQLDDQKIKKYIIEFLINQPGVAAVIDPSDIYKNALPEQVSRMMINGYNQKLSGDLQILLKPQWVDQRTKGSTHGLWNPYDARIPLLWFGWNISPGKTYREVYMSDIAPTLAALLKIPTPNASVGKVITEIVR